MYAVTGAVYLLRDNFSAAIAAGSLDNTKADPGPGTRDVVTDTNSKLSITGGALSFATGGVGAGDPGLWYTSQTRAVGRALMASVNVAVAAPLIGWDSNQAGDIVGGIAFAGSGNLQSKVNALTIGAYSTGVAYSIAVIFRATGEWLLIKGGAFTNWTLLWASPTNNTATVYPVLTVNNTGSVHTVDDFRIPQDLIVIQPLAYDTFTRADAALGSTETSGPDSQALTAKAWTGATFTISTNKAINTPALGADAIVNGAFAADTDWTKGAGWTIAGGVGVATAATSNLDAAVAPLTVGTWYQTAFTMAGFAAGTGKVVLGGVSFPTHGSNATFTETGRAGSTAFALTAAGGTFTVDNVSALALTLSELFASISVSPSDVLAEVNVTLSAALNGLQAGLVLNLDSAATPANFVIAYLDGRGNAVLDKCVAGVYTNVISAAVTYSAGAALRVSKIGTGYRLTYNNAAVGTGTISDAGIISNTLHGLFNTSASNSLDVFVTWATGAGNEHAVLNSY